MVVTDILSDDVHKTFSLFSEMIGKHHWARAVDQLQQRMAQNQFIKDVLHEEYAIASKLAALDEELVTRGNSLSERERAHYDVASFISQVVSISKANPEYASRLHGRVRGALFDGDLMRGLLHELRTAVHLTLRGRKLHWPEINQTGNQASGCDFIITDLPKPVNVDCKAFGTDTGRRITRVAAGLLFNAIHARIPGRLDNVRSGLAVVVTLPGRLDVNQQVQQHIADGVMEAITSARIMTLPDQTSISIREFDPKVLSRRPESQSPELRRIVDSVAGARNQSTVAISTKAGGALMFTVQSLKSNRTVEAMFDTMKTCARDQLPREQAGLIVAEIPMADQALYNIATMRQTTGRIDPFTRAANKFWNSENRRHVVGIALVAKGSLGQNSPGLLQHTGLSYYMKHERSELWLPELAGLFSK